MMVFKFMYRVIFLGLVIAVLPHRLMANTVSNNFNEIVPIVLSAEMNVLQDSIPAKNPTNKPEVKEVPKARPKLKPSIVTDQVKKIKIKKPKIIKLPIRIVGL
ncbi:MAG: hypothetical protein JWN56_1014 [Sphingobacteriales bacterium]|nr:hypothetical protein [Sphingobacteriales bacterium]